MVGIRTLTATESLDRKVFPLAALVRSSVLEKMLLSFQAALPRVFLTTAPPVKAKAAIPAALAPPTTRALGVLL